MRVLLFAQVAAVALLMSGCPGATVSDPTGGGCVPGQNCSTTGSSSGGEGGKANTGGSGGSGGASGGNGGSGGVGGGPKECEPLLLDVMAQEEKARICSIELPQSTQCNDIVQGLCCPIAVTNMDSPEVQAYLEALKAYLDAGCVPSCPPIPCPTNPDGSCMPGMGSNGSCTIPP
jgi:hypothetical protein